ncbi:MAG: hypothetical protein ABIH17_04690 [Pseudomonadota bacterium]
MVVTWAVNEIAQIPMLIVAVAKVTHSMARKPAVRRKENIRLTATTQMASLRGS